MRWLALFFISVPCVLQAAEARLPRVAILPFGWAEDAGRDIYDVELPGNPEPAGQAAQADAVLWQHLPTVIKADWVERSQIQQMLEEQELQIFSSGNALRAGRWLKADVALVGIIRESARKQSPYIEYLDVDICVVDLTSGENLASATWKPELVHRRHEPWPAASIEPLKALCADLLKEGLERRISRKAVPKIVPLFFRNTSDVERLNFWEGRLFTALAEKLPTRIPVRILLFPGMRETRQEQELSLLGLTDADPDAWKKVGDYFIWGEYSEKNPDKPTEFQETEVTFTWNFWDGGGVLVTKIETFRVSEAQAKLDAWLEEIAALAKTKHTEDKTTQNLDRVHGLLMERVREILQPRSTDETWIGNFGELGRSSAINPEKRILYALQLLDLAAFFKPEDPGCRFLPLVVGRSSNQKRYEFLDRFSGRLSGQSLVYRGQVLRDLGYQQTGWAEILKPKDRITRPGWKKDYDKEQREAAQKHLSRWKAEMARWADEMESEKIAGRPPSDQLVKVNLKLAALMVEQSPGEALQLIVLAFENLTLKKRLETMSDILPMVRKFREYEEMEDRLVRALLAYPKEEAPLSPIPRDFIGPRQPYPWRSPEPNVLAQGEWHVLPLLSEPFKMPSYASFAQAEVADIRNNDFRPEYPFRSANRETAETLVCLPCGVVTGQLLVQESLGLARYLPFRGMDYAQLGHILYIARQNEEPAWINLETGEKGVFALEEGLPTKAFSTCMVLDEDHILWSGYLSDPATGKSTPRRAIWKASEKKWIRLANQEDIPNSPINSSKTVAEYSTSRFGKPNLWKGRIIYPGIKKAVSPLTGETVDLGWIGEKLPFTPETFTHTELGWLVIQGNVVGLVDDKQKLLWRVELPGKPSRTWVGEKWVWFEFYRRSQRQPFFGPSTSTTDLPIAAVSLDDGALAGPHTLHGTVQIGKAVAAPEGLWIDYRPEWGPMSFMDHRPEWGSMNLNRRPPENGGRVALIPNPRKLDREGIKALAEVLPMQTAAAGKNIPRREWPSYTGKPWQDPVPELVTLAGHGTLSQIKQAIQKGASVSASTITGWTPLMSAAKRGDSEIVRELLVSGADPDQPMINGWTPVAEALIWRNYGIAAMLVKAGAPFSHNHINVFPQEQNSKDSRVVVSYSAPALLLRYADEEAFIAILDRLEDPLRWLPWSYGRTKILGALLDTHGSEMTEEQLATVAARAWSAGDTSVALAAVRRLPDPNWNLAGKEQVGKKSPYRPILGLALKYGDIESLKNLVDRGGRLTAPLDNEEGKGQAYTIAVATKKTEAVRLAALAGARADLPVGLGSDGGEALYQAAVGINSWPMIEALLEAGIPPLSKNRAGLTPVEWRQSNLSKSALELRKQLLEVAKIEIGAQELVNNLDFIWQDDERLAQMWMSSNPPMENGYKFRDQTSCTPLSAAIMENSEKYARLFLAAGANPNGGPLNNQLDRTHLMEAAMAGHLNLLKVLVENGAALRKRDRLMATARHLAANEECARFLRQEETWEREAEKLEKILRRAKYNNKTNKRDYDDKAIIEQIRACPESLLAPNCEGMNDGGYFWEYLFQSGANYENVVRWTQESGVDFNQIQSKNGELALVHAVAEGSEWKVKILLKLGSLPEAKGRNGRNAISALDTVKDEKVRAILRELLTQKPTRGS